VIPVRNIYVVAPQAKASVSRNANMLTLFNISNVALIDELRAEFDRGLNLLTGETGSGKSIIVDALGVLIGGRFTSDLLKAGAQQAFIEGLFPVERNPEMEAMLAAAGIEMASSADQGAEANEIIIRRELSAVGKNKIFINNQLATQSLLRDLRQFLVDIHGQGDQQTLFNPETHLELLDAFAPVAALRHEVADFYQRWDGLKRELDELQQDEAEKFQLIDLLRFQIDELERPQLGALSNADAKHFHGRLPTWNNFVNHPNYDSFWKKEALDYQLRPLTVPTMHVGGWWDQEDFYGPLRAYEVLEKTDTDHLNYVVVGPWNHGGWERRDGDKLGNVDFGMPTSKYFRERFAPHDSRTFSKTKGTGTSSRQSRLKQVSTSG
jgi:hypothetical protein